VLTNRQVVMADKQCGCAAVAYWLRDLDLTDLWQAFARQLLVNFVESLTILTDNFVNRHATTHGGERSRRCNAESYGCVYGCRLVQGHQDRQKVNTAVREMKVHRVAQSVWMHFFRLSDR
jgi:hypothetical protein